MEENIQNQVENQVEEQVEESQIAANPTKILTDAFSGYLQATNTLISLISNSQANDVRTYASSEFNKINKILSPKVTYKIDEEEYEYTGPIDLIATDVKYNRKKGFITYITNVSIEIPAGYTAFVNAPLDLKSARAYIVNNIPEDLNNIAVIYKSYDKYNNFPYEIGDVIGKLYIVKTL